MRAHLFSQVIVGHTHVKGPAARHALTLTNESSVIDTPDGQINIHHRYTFATANMVTLNILKLVLSISPFSNLLSVSYKF